MIERLGEQLVASQGQPNTLCLLPSPLPLMEDSDHWQRRSKQTKNDKIFRQFPAVLARCSHLWSGMGDMGMFNWQKPWLWPEQRAVKRLGEPYSSSWPSGFIHFRRTGPVPRPNLKARLFSTYLVHYIQVSFIKKLRQTCRKYSIQTSMPCMFQAEPLKILHKLNQCIWKGKIVFICSFRRSKGLEYVG